MDMHALLVVLLVCSLIAFTKGVEAGNRNFSAEEDLEFERQLKSLKKPAIKTILTEYGEIYDCVDFYKQPAFDHPLLKNYTINYQLKPSPPYNSSNDDVSLFGLKGRGCPFGTVPIKRITKEDLIRAKLASEARTLSEDNERGAHYAVYRTKPGPDKYYGAGAEGIVVYNPQVEALKYSAARVKISNGPNSLEVGWMVNPTLYGDGRVRLYISTDTGKENCFDARCGFVVTDNKAPPGSTFNGVSTRGGDTKAFRIYIIRDMSNGNWLLQYGPDSRQLGFWPKELFTGLADFATSVEWGGEVFSIPGTPKPDMGAGYIPDGKNVDYDAFFRNPSFLNGQSTIVASNLEPFQDSKNYQVRDVKKKQDYFRYTIFYGGSGGSPDI